MKTAFVKQLLDVHGPWSGVLWKDTDPRRLFQVWPGKGTFWEMTCLLRADWYIVPQQLVSDYTQDAVLKHPGRSELIPKYTSGVVSPADIPFDNYDVVITFDPILNVSRESQTLFAYFVVEHWDRLYGRSLRRPLAGYDLFLAHMGDSEERLRSLPQAVSFPYLRDPGTVRSIFSAHKEEVAWVDWRTLATLGMTQEFGPWNDACEAAATRLQEVLGIPIRYKGGFSRSPYGVADPPLWGDAALYFEAIAGCRYYIAVGGMAGAGQAIGDAASLGCLCIGQQDKPYHRMTCHPSCLCVDLAEMPARLRSLASSRDLQAEVLAWQDAALRKQFAEGPLALLREALRLKRERQVSPERVLAAEGDRAL